MAVNLGPELHENNFSEDWTSGTVPNALMMNIPCKNQKHSLGFLSILPSGSTK